MGGDEDRAALGARGVHEREDRVAAGRIQAPGGLVQHEQGRTGRERRGDREAPLLPSREREGARPGQRREVRGLQELLAELRVRRPGGGEHLLAHGRGDEGVLRVLRDPRDGLGGGARDRPCEHVVQAEDGAQERRLARAAGAGQRDQLARARRERQPLVQRPAGPVGVGEGDVVEHEDGRSAIGARRSVPVTGWRGARRNAPRAVRHRARRSGHVTRRCRHGVRVDPQARRLDRRGVPGEHLVRAPVGDDPGPGAQHDQPVG